MNRVYISVDRRECDGALQLSIGVIGQDGSDHGYRLAGPKYDGRGKILLRHFLTERDVREIRAHIRSSPSPKLVYDKSKRTIVAQR